ncbi:hypothetical protein MIR68_005344 [Amoeboaphelidium protococcarum]|nr:hypothetical protein MIR68_005344 [Amoeboaphelidium protococcarum]
MKHIPRAVSVHRNRQQLQQSQSSQQQPHTERQKQQSANAAVSSKSAQSRKRKQEHDDDGIEPQKYQTNDAQARLKANAIANKKLQDQGIAMDIDNQNGVDDADEPLSMERLLGFGSFKSTKGQKVQDDKMVSGANIVKERKVRRVVKQKKK